MTQIPEAAFLLVASLLSAGPLCSRYSTCHGHRYVPAPPGHTPSCAEPGGTFCEAVDHYPRQLIRYLIEKWGYDYDTLLSDESREDFGERELRKEYGYPVPVHFGRDSVTVIQPSISFGPINVTTQLLEGGYPDRRYKIEPYFLTNGLQLISERSVFRAKNGGVAQVPDFRNLRRWKRYERSSERNESPRGKRQLPLTGSLCPTRATYIMPRAALNTRGNWMYTVNLNEVDGRYTQLVRSETCISNRCSGLCSLPNGYSSRCQQQYVQKRLIALEGNGERLYSDVFWFPHCCVCQITTN